MENTPVFDLHSDIINAITYYRGKGEKRVFARRYLPLFTAGHVWGTLAVLWVERAYHDRPLSRLLQLLGAFFADLAEGADVAALATSAAELDRYRREGKFVFVLGVEGLGFIEQWPATESDAALETDLFEQAVQAWSVLHRCGVRHAILAWNEVNAIASGAALLDAGHTPRSTPDPCSPGHHRGLTPGGRKIVRMLSRHKTLLDLSHLDEVSFWDVFEEAGPGKLLASHSNARKLCDVPRNLNDLQIKALAGRGGLIGINAWPGFIDAQAATVDRLVDHIVYIGNLAGLQHVACGFDFTDFLPPGTVNYGPDFSATRGLESITQVPVLLKTMRKRGFTDAEIKRVAAGNAVDFLTSSW